MLATYLPRYLGRLGSCRLLYMADQVAGAGVCMRFQVWLGTKPWDGANYLKLGTNLRDGRPHRALLVFRSSAVDIWAETQKQRLFRYPSPMRPDASLADSRARMYRPVK